MRYLRYSLSFSGCTLFYMWLLKNSFHSCISNMETDSCMCIQNIYLKRCAYASGQRKYWVTIEKLSKRYEDRPPFPNLSLFSLGQIILVDLSQVCSVCPLHWSGSNCRMSTCCHMAKLYVLYLKMKYLTYYSKLPGISTFIW